MSRNLEILNAEVVVLLPLHIFTPSLTSAKAYMIRHNPQAYKRFLKMDLNGDGVVTKAEFDLVKPFKKTAIEFFLEDRRKAGAFLLQSLDENKDNQVSEEEFSKNFPNHQVRISPPGIRNLTCHWRSPTRRRSGGSRSASSFKPSTGLAREEDMPAKGPRRGAGLRRALRRTAFD